MNTNFTNNINANLDALRYHMSTIRADYDMHEETANKLWKRVKELEADELVTDEELEKAYEEYDIAWDTCCDTRDRYDSCEAIYNHLLEIKSILHRAENYYGLDLDK